MLQPKNLPGFVFAWLDIVGHRNFIGRMLAYQQQPQGPSMVKFFFLYKSFYFYFLHK